MSWPKLQLNPTEEARKRLQQAAPPRPTVANTPAPNIHQYGADRVQARIDALRGLDTNYSPEKRIQRHLIAREQPILDALRAGKPPSLDTYAKAQSRAPLPFATEQEDGSVERGMRFVGYGAEAPGMDAYVKPSDRRKATTAWAYKGRKYADKRDETLAEIGHPYYRKLFEEYYDYVDSENERRAERERQAAFESANQGGV